jgi:hypothetical protein
MDSDAMIREHHRITEEQHSIYNEISWNKMFGHDFSFLDL